MQRFAPALRRVAAELDVPPGVRAAILLELASDLESAWEHGRRQGLTEEEAARRAEAAVVGSVEAVRRLGRVHRRRGREWPQWAAWRLSAGADLLLVLVAAVPLVVLAGAVATRTLVLSPAPVTWVLLGLGATITVVVALQVLRPRPDGLATLPVLAGTATATGALGALLSSWRFVTGGVPDTMALMRQVEVAGAALLAGLALGIMAVFAWFLLLHRSASRAAREVDRLLNDASSPEMSRRPDDVLPLIPRRQA